MPEIHVRPTHVSPANIDVSRELAVELLWDDGTLRLTIDEALDLFGSLREVFLHPQIEMSAEQWQQLREIASDPALTRER